MSLRESIGSSAEWTARDAAALSPVIGRLTDVVAVRGEGSWLWDADGRRYLDLTSGIAVTNLGHGHPRVLDAAEKQMRQLVHTSVVARHPPGIELAELLRALTPFMDDPLVFYCNTGAEAVEGALKLTRRVTGRPNVIAFRGAFHGRTLGATSLTTAKGRYREGYDPLLPGVHVAPYADPDRLGTDEALAALDDLLAQQVSPSSVGAMVVEPVLGEGGYVVPAPGWLEGLRERCHRHGILLVFDEVQCGAGRTGQFWAAETFGVAPDVLLFAKGVANGFPLGGIIAPRSLMERWPTGTHGSTFGGNPVSCAAACAVIDVIAETRLLRRTRLLGARLLEALGGLASEFPSIVRSVRGIGLMVGIRFVDAATRARVQAACARDGVLLLSCGPEEDVLRLIPPLTISDDELALGMETLSRALREADDPGRLDGHRSG